MSRAGAGACGQCGSRLAENGTCPVCLIGLGFERTGEAAGVAGSSIVSGRDRIGPYQLLEILGEGGMGIVYLAEQRRPIRRRAALKLIKPGMDSAQVIARFESERQALALMSHPNVARVLDAGVSDDGRPYFVMEYVQGIPITAYCDMHRLPVRERLGLFLQACDALQHAHQKGIIHRDIKPSNVLVCVEDDRPAAKVIDFGVAKAMSRKLTDRTLHTQQGMVIGTPDYMSPEQAGAAGADVDTRADIYSLGVVLYELLAGVLPFDPRQLRAVAEPEMLRIIREVDPPRLSARLRTLGAAGPEIAGLRGTEVSSLARLLSGELEWIVLKAIEKNPARRYDSVSELGADIRHYLVDELVLARPPSAWYRARKFVHRNRGVVAALVAIALTLSAGLVVSIALYFRAASARDRERLAAGEARAINDFMRNMLSSAQPGRLGHDAKLLDVIAAGAAKVDESFANEPEVRTALHDTIGSVYRELAMFPEAEHHTRLALEGRERELGRGDARTIDTRVSLARQYWESHRYDESIAEFRTALADATLYLGPRHPVRVDAMHLLGNVLNLAGRHAEAEPLLKDALALNEEVNGPDTRLTTTNQQSLGMLYYYTHRLDDAAAQYERALETDRRILPPGSWLMIRVPEELSRVRMAQGRLDEAARLLDGLVDVATRQLGEAHVQTLYVVGATAELDLLRGRFDEAERLVRHALEVHRATDQGGAVLPSAWRYLTMVLAEEGKDEAIDAGRELVTSARRTFKEPNDMIARFIRWDAVALYKAATKADFEASAARFGESLAMYRTLFGNDHPAIAETLHVWGRMEHARGHHDQAAAKYREALAMWERLGYDAPYTTGEIRSDLGLCLLETGRAAEAEPFLVGGYETLRDKRGEADGLAVAALDRLAALYERTGRSAQAAALRRRRPATVSRFVTVRTITGLR